MSSPEPKHNRITDDEDNIVQPVFWQTPCNVQADLSNGMVLIVSRGFGSVCKPQRGTKVSVVSGFCVPFVPVCRLSRRMFYLVGISIKANILLWQIKFIKE